MLHPYKWWFKKKTGLCLSQIRRNWNCCSLCRLIVGRVCICKVLNNNIIYIYKLSGRFPSCTTASTYTGCRHTCPSFIGLKCDFYYLMKPSSKKEQLFSFPIRFVKHGAAGQSAGDSWILTTQWVGYWSMHGRRRCAATDIDACVCGRLCVYLSCGHGKNHLFCRLQCKWSPLFYFVTLPSSLFLNSDSAVILERYLQFLTNYQPAGKRLRVFWQPLDS